MEVLLESLVVIFVTFVVFDIEVVVVFWSVEVLVKFEDGRLV